MHLIPPEDEQLRISIALYRMRKAGRLPRLWIDGTHIRLEIRPFLLHSVSWAQALRIIEGESLESVVRGVKLPAAVGASIVQERVCA